MQVFRNVLQQLSELVGSEKSLARPRIGRHREVRDITVPDFSFTFCLIQHRTEVYENASNGWVREACFALLLDKTPNGVGIDIQHGHLSEKIIRVFDVGFCRGKPAIGVLFDSLRYDAPLVDLEASSSSSFSLAVRSSTFFCAASTSCFFDAISVSSSFNMAAPCVSEEYSGLL
jgi:hypothetical protein